MSLRPRLAAGVVPELSLSRVGTSNLGLTNSAEIPVSFELVDGEGGWLESFRPIDLNILFF